MLQFNPAAMLGDVATVNLFITSTVTPTSFAPASSSSYADAWITLAGDSSLSSAYVIGFTKQAGAG